MEKSALEREFSVDRAAGGYGSRRLRGLEKAVLEREPSGEAEGCSRKEEEEEGGRKGGNEWDSV